ncbi:hypothetical protein LNP74_31120 [Klebsiella pneumoniae subsp. pneumoniae]|nr:hypothetical protein [Klebsiella pneumoniae subsp. pneumoniae]
MAYELGAGLRHSAVRPDPDPQLQRLYCAAVWPGGAMAQQAASSIGEAVSLSQALPAGGGARR